MAILVDRNTKLITIGFSNDQAIFHSLQSRDYGTTFVGGVAAGEGGVIKEGFPVFNTVYAAMKKTDANCAMIFSGPEDACDAILECIEAQMPLIICITKGIPFLDMLTVKNALKNSKSRLIGPNCWGVITPGESKVGVMPGHIYMPGNVGVVSRSSSLAYDVNYQLTQLEIGQSTCVGLGSDSVLGTNFVDVLMMFEDDPDTSVVVMIGEIGGHAELKAAEWIEENMTKPVVSFIAGASAKLGKQMGHTGAIVLAEDDSAEAKFKKLEECGVIICHSSADIGEKVKEVLNVKQK